MIFLSYFSLFLNGNIEGQAANHVLNKNAKVGIYLGTALHERGTIFRNPVS